MDTTIGEGHTVFLSVIRPEHTIPAVHCGLHGCSSHVSVTAYRHLRVMGEAGDMLLSSPPTIPVSLCTSWCLLWAPRYPATPQGPFTSTPPGVSVQPSLGTDHIQSPSPCMQRSQYWHRGKAHRAP